MKPRIFFALVFTIMLSMSVFALTYNELPPTVEVTTGRYMTDTFVAIGTKLGLGPEYFNSRSSFPSLKSSVEGAIFDFYSGILDVSGAEEGTKIILTKKPLTEVVDSLKATSMIYEMGLSDLDVTLAADTFEGVNKINETRINLSRERGALADSVRPLPEQLRSVEILGDGTVSIYADAAKRVGIDSEGLNPNQIMAEIEVAGYRIADVSALGSPVAISDSGSRVPDLIVIQELYGGPKIPDLRIPLAPAPVERTVVSSDEPRIPFAPRDQVLSEPAQSYYYAGTDDSIYAAVARDQARIVLGNDPQNAKDVLSHYYILEDDIQDGRLVGIQLTEKPGGPKLIPPGQSGVFEEIPAQFPEDVSSAATERIDMRPPADAPVEAPPSLMREQIDEIQVGESIASTPAPAEPTAGRTVVRETFDSQGDVLARTTTTDGGASATGAPQPETVAPPEAPVVVPQDAVPATPATVTTETAPSGETTGNWVQLEDETALFSDTGTSLVPTEAGFTPKAKWVVYNGSNYYWSSSDNAFVKTNPGIRGNLFRSAPQIRNTFKPVSTTLVKGVKFIRANTQSKSFTKSMGALFIVQAVFEVCNILKQSFLFNNSAVVGPRVEVPVHNQTSLDFDESSFFIRFNGNETGQIISKDSLPQFLIFNPNASKNILYAQGALVDSMTKPGIAGFASTFFSTFTATGALDTEVLAENPVIVNDDGVSFVVYDYSELVGKGNFVVLLSQNCPKTDKKTFTCDLSTLNNKLAQGKKYFIELSVGINKSIPILASSDTQKYLLSNQCSFLNKNPTTNYCDLVFRPQFQDESGALRPDLLDEVNEYKTSNWDIGLGALKGVWGFIWGTAKSYGQVVVGDEELYQLNKNYGLWRGNVGGQVMSRVGAASKAILGTVALVYSVPSALIALGGSAGLGAYIEKHVQDDQKASFNEIMRNQLSLGVMFSGFPIIQEFTYGGTGAVQPGENFETGYAILEITNADQIKSMVWSGSEKWSFARYSGLHQWVKDSLGNIVASTNNGSMKFFEINGKWYLVVGNLRVSDKRNSNFTWGANFSFANGSTAMNENGQFGYGPETNGSFPKEINAGTPPATPDELAALLASS